VARDRAGYLHPLQSEAQRVRKEACVAPGRPAAPVTAVPCALTANCSSC
jgi:hypothetical protein